MEQEEFTESAISVNEYNDGELFCFIEIANGENECEMWFDRKCAKQIIQHLQDYLGEE